MTCRITQPEYPKVRRRPMPTQEQLDRMVAEFEREYPESLSDRLKWWVRRPRHRPHPAVPASGPVGPRGGPDTADGLASGRRRAGGSRRDGGRDARPASGLVRLRPAGAARGPAPARRTGVRGRTPGHAPARCRRSAPLHAQSAGAEGNPAQSDRRGRAVPPCAALQAYLSETRRPATAAGEGRKGRPTTPRQHDGTIHVPHACGRDSLLSGHQAWHKALRRPFRDGLLLYAGGPLPSTPSAHRLRIRRCPGVDHRDGVLPGPGMAGADRRRADGDTGPPAEADAADLSRSSRPTCSGASRSPHRRRSSTSTIRSPTSPSSTRRSRS